MHAEQAVPRGCSFKVGKSFFCSGFSGKCWDFTAPAGIRWFFYSLFLLCLKKIKNIKSKEIGIFFGQNSTLSKGRSWKICSRFVVVLLFRYPRKLNPSFGEFFPFLQSFKSLNFPVGEESWGKKITSRICLCWCAQSWVWNEFQSGILRGKKNGIFQLPGGSNPGEMTKYSKYFCIFNIPVSWGFVGIPCGISGDLGCRKRGKKPQTSTNCEEKYTKGF